MKLWSFKWLTIIIIVDKGDEAVTHRWTPIDKGGNHKLKAFTVQVRHFLPFCHIKPHPGYYDLSTQIWNRSWKASFAKHPVQLTGCACDLRSCLKWDGFCFNQIVHRSKNHHKHPLGIWFQRLVTPTPALCKRQVYLFILIVICFPKRMEDSASHKTGQEIIFHVILFSYNKEGRSDTSYNIDEPWGHDTQGDKSVVEGQVLCDSTHMRSL